MTRSKEYGDTGHEDGRTGWGTLGRVLDAKDNELGVALE
jgi:hypothetical protein